MNLPITEAIPKSSRCPMCRKKIGNKFVCINMGAFQHGSFDDDLSVFLNLTEHDHYSDKSRSVDVVEIEGKVGQMDMYLCSSKCLRVFFNKIVDEFENK